MAIEQNIIIQIREQSEPVIGCQGSPNSTQPKTAKVKKNKSGSKKTRDRMLAVASLILIVIAWAIGSYQENTDIGPYLNLAMPNADRIESSKNGNYVGYANDEILGYISVGVASGYGGPVQMAVATDLQGVVTGLSLVRHIETPSFFERVAKDGLVPRLIGKTYSDDFKLGKDVDGISGATYTSQGIAESVFNATQDIASQELNITLPPSAAAEIKFGAPEITLLALFLLRLIGNKAPTTFYKKLRWLSLITGMVFLGFIYTNPLTISLINKMLLGFWPDWHTHLYWYMLLFGVVISLVVFEKNAYCEWICPFGATQECMGKLGGAKAHNLNRFKSHMRWLQRGVALTAIVLALIYRNPGISSYEIFGALFDLEGSIAQLILLGLVLLASLFVLRPWCRYLCPMHPIESFIKLFNNWRKELWLNARHEKRS